MRTSTKDGTGRAVTALAALAAGLAALAAPPVVPRAKAAMVPNYARYCATFYRGSTVTLDPMTGTRRCTVTGGFLSRTRHYPIDLATACRLTTGALRYRVHGGGYVLCAERNEPRVAANGGAVQGGAAPRPAPEPTSATVAPNLRRYCARRLRRSHPWYQASHARWLCVRKHRRKVRAVVVDLTRACVLSGGGAVVFAGGDRRRPRCVQQRLASGAGNPGS